MGLWPMAEMLTPMGGATAKASWRLFGWKLAAGGALQRLGCARVKTAKLVVMPRCVVCMDAFVTNRPQQKFCSDQCRMEVGRTRSRADYWDKHVPRPRALTKAERLAAYRLAMEIGLFGEGCVTGSVEWRARHLQACQAPEAHNWHKSKAGNRDEDIRRDRNRRKGRNKKKAREQRIKAACQAFREIGLILAKGEQ